MDIEVNLGINTDTTFDEARALTMTKVARMLHKQGGPRDSSPYIRYALHGIRINGQLLVLPTVKQGRTLLTMAKWAMAFWDARQRLIADANRQQQPRNTAG